MITYCHCFLCNKKPGKQTNISLWSNPNTSPVLLSLLLWTRKITRQIMSTKNIQLKLMSPKCVSRNFENKNTVCDWKFGKTCFPRIYVFVIFPDPGSTTNRSLIGETHFRPCTQNQGFSHLRTFGHGPRSGGSRPFEGDNDWPKRKGWRRVWLVGWFVGWLMIVGSGRTSTNWRWWVGENN